LVDAVSIPPLSDFGLNSPDFAGIARQGQKASSMKGNPLALTDEELMEILEKAA
jgi:alcohol dehydrogenase class IV